MTPLLRSIWRRLPILMFALGCGGALPEPIEEGAPGMQAESFQPANVSLSGALLDDHGDTPATATHLPASSASFGGTLESSLDRDVFAFQSGARHFYRFHCTFPEPLVGWGLELIDSAGRRLDWVPVWISSGRSLYFKTHSAQTTYLRMYAVHEELSGSYSCVLEDVGQDDHGDTVETATPWLPSTQATGVMELRTDMDVFTVSLSHGAFHGVTCTSQNPAVSCRVKVLSPTGSSTGEPTGTVSFNATHDGIYRVEVTSVFAQDSIVQAAYTLQFVTLGTDDHGDAREYATPVTPSSVPFTGQLSGGLDRDVFSFTTQVGHIYLFSCEVVPGYSVGPHLLLTNGTGQMVDVHTYVENQPTRVSVDAAAVAEYFVEVGFGAYVGPYSCRLEDLGSDDHGDTLVDATEVLLPSLLTGHLETRLDVDVFSFSVRAGHHYSLQQMGGTGNAGAVRLKNAQGTVLHTLSGGFTFLSSEEAVYFLEVDVAPFGWAGTFSIWARDLGPDDHGDTPATATPLEPGLPVSGACYVSTDVDVFTFTMEANALYRVSCTGCDPKLESPAGPLRTLKTTQGTTISYHLDADATAPVYVVVRAGLYQLTLEYLGTDDHGDDLVHATPITYPLLLPAVLDSAFDVDVFSLSLLAGQPRRVKATAGFGTVVSVVAPDGTAVPRSFAGDFTPTQSGLHHLRVRPDIASGSFTYGPYSLILD
ncbi:hypothetical protein [Myxococcus sp. CA040A]|uniref:hypothetical protein n=1 Tax=Myxococcus sp. CA040A TaxID=2741738 RepID=UPI00157A3DFB|nr:hypothetical protein [Myxococcus sp. CA040A]NTX08361.1 hypothetical protein [Myxococcus sp. CA040A]